MSGTWKEKEWEGGGGTKVTDGGKVGPDKAFGTKDGKDKEGSKEVYKESWGKESSQDKAGKDSAGKSESGDYYPHSRTLDALHRRISALEAALGIGAHFIGPDERPDVGAVALNQPMNKKEG